MMVTRPYEQGDLGRLNSREDSNIVISEDWAWTICSDGGPIAVFSVVEFWSGVGHIVGVVDERVREHGLAFSRASKKLFKMSMQVLTQYQRIQTYTFNEENANWARLMGLKYECTMKRASDKGLDIDVYCYLR